MAATDLACDTLLALCAKGDQQAFFQLYQREAPSMLALATHMLGKPDDAQDMVRDTLVVIWKNADAWDPESSSARAWIHSILRYRTLNRLRQVGRKHPMTTARVSALHNSQASGLMHTSAFSDKLAELNETQRHPLLMAFYHACSYEQMAQPLQQTTAQLRNNLQQALRTLEPTVLA